jgi:hypothetical protein
LAGGRCISFRARKTGEVPDSALQLPCSPAQQSLGLCALGPRQPAAGGTGLPAFGWPAREPGHPIRQSKCNAAVSGGFQHRQGWVGRLRVFERHECRTPQPNDLGSGFCGDSPRAGGCQDGPRDTWSP